MVTLRPSVLGDKTGLRPNNGLGIGLVHCGLGLAGLMLCCYARCYNNLEEFSNFSILLIYSFSILSSERHYRGDQQSLFTRAT